MAVEHSPVPRGSAAAAPVASLDDVPSSQGERPTVLVVEDDADLLVCYEELLHHEGFNTLVATSMSEAIELFRRNMRRVGVVLTDFNLPDGSGARLVAEMRCVRPDLSVVLISGHSDGDPQIRAVRVGPRTVLMTKPVQVAEVAATLRGILAQG